MYPPGHLALGYFSGVLYRRMTGKDFNLIVIWAFSLLPDLDLFIPGVVHRGPTHSVVVALLFFAPVWYFYRDSLSYLFSLLSHSLIGDYFTAAGCQLFWPLDLGWFRYEYALCSENVMLLYLEGFLFLVMLGLLGRRRLGLFSRVSDE